MSELIIFDKEKGETDSHVFEQMLANELAIFMFSAPWCNPCHRFTPTVAKIATQTDDVAFFKVDIEDFQQSAEYFGVTVVPTLMFCYNGKVVHAMQGGNESKLRAGIGILQRMKNEKVVV